MATIVTIWHNVARGPFDRPLGMLDGFKPEHPVTPVARYQVGPDDVSVSDEETARGLAQEAFTTFNVGEDPDFNGGLEAYRVDLALEYRKRRNRSLSVGDVVQVNGCWLACDRGGWRRIESPALLVWADVYGSHALSPQGEARPLNTPTVSLLDQIVRASRNEERVGRVIDDVSYKGTARGIYREMGTHLTGDDDVRDGYLRVTLDSASIDTYWPILELLADLVDGQFFTNIP